LAGPQILQAFADRYPRAFFVEIGANDGEQHDHLRPLILAGEWRGIMVEPVPYVFERLRENYGGVTRVTLENSAIAGEDGELPFFHLGQAAEEDGDVPFWYHGLGSFSRETVLRHGRDIADIERRLVATQVPCLTFDSLLAKHGVEFVDLLLIDTEGYDSEVLRLIDLERDRPHLLVYEHYHLAAADRWATRQRLQDAGYRTLEEGFDTWCLGPQAAAPLHELWPRMRPAVPGRSVYDEDR